MSIFGDLTDDILNGNVEDNNLPSDDDQAQGETEGGEGDGADGKDGVKIEPKKRAVRNPRQRLTIETLQGKRGIHTIEEYFKDVKFAGKGHEKNDLNEVMRRLQHWAHRMYPSYKFEDVLTNIERLGKKKTLHVHMNKYRLGMLERENLENVQDADDEIQPIEDEPFDEFDALLDEQIAISKLAPKTPSHHNRSVMSVASSITTPKFGQGNAAMSTPYSRVDRFLPDESDLAQPLPASQPPTPVQKTSLNSDQMAKIAENRRLAQERLKAKREAAALEQTLN